MENLFDTLLAQSAVFPRIRAATSFRYLASHVQLLGRPLFFTCPWRGQGKFRDFELKVSEDRESFFEKSKLFKKYQNLYEF